MALFAFFASACGESEDAFAPKPRGFHRIDLPEHLYQPLERPSPYFFEYPAASQILEDTSFIAEPHWIEVNYKDIDAIISIAYKRIDNKKELLEAYINDSHKLTYKHSQRASAINEFITSNPNGLRAVVYELDGDVPSFMQFYATDSVNHFFRAALYFPTSVKSDSLKPVIDHAKYDMMRLLNTLRFVK